MLTERAEGNVNLPIRVAVASQNRRSVTAHAGRCRRFWVYDLQGGEAGPGKLVELAKEGTLHALRPGIPPELSDLDVLIAADLCDNLCRRLERHGIEGLASTCATPDEAVRELLAERSLSVLGLR
jgi:predicted Fe-Mo cluster-binding NifX family protein